MLTGRIVSALALVITIVTSLQVGGAFDLLPPKVTAALLVAAGVAASLTERLQGGASDKNVRMDAAEADAATERKARLDAAEKREW